MRLKQRSTQTRSLPRYSEGKEIRFDGTTYIVRGYSNSKTVPNAYIRLEAPDGTIIEKARDWVAIAIAAEREKATACPDE